MIGITETHMDELYDLKIDNYEIYPNSRNKDGGGIVIAVRKELKYVTTEVKKTKEKIESLWVLIDNGRIKIRIGVVYFPQEQDQDLKEIYKIIKSQVHESGERKESILIMGDFNCKVGSECIKGNHESKQRWKETDENGGKRRTSNNKLDGKM